MIKRVLFACLKKIYHYIPGNIKNTNAFRAMMKHIYLHIIKRFVPVPNPNVKSYWDDRLCEYDSFWRDENYRYILDLFPKNEEFSLLDVGCAIGNGCELLQREFPKAKITGIDISDKGIEKAKQKTNTIEYFVVDILKDSIPGIYDYIIIVETLEHFDDPFFVINKCLKHVRRSIIVSTPYSPAITGKLVYEEGNEHRFLFNEKTFIGYKHRIIKITEFIKATMSRCIIYEIFPEAFPNNPK